MARNPSWPVLAWSLVIVVLLLLPCRMPAQTVRDPSWATPVSVDGVANLYKVSDSLYRSAQPTADGLKKLKALGVATVIDLREFHNDRQPAAQAALTDDELAVQTWHITDQEVIAVMKLLGNAHGGPYLVHCHHGSDRTGLMIAMYRIIYQHWSKQQAITEMTDGGYGFHAVWQNIITYINTVDVAVIAAGIAAADTAPALK
jgi:protein tyrosine/serine phosphatase